MSSQSVTTALTPLTAEMLSALATINENFKRNRPIKTTKPMHWLSYSALIAAAVCSGILYWNTSAAAEDRYGVLSTSLLAFCGCLTNIGFNLESYFTTFTAETEEYRQSTSPLRQKEYTCLRWGFGITSGFITTLPLWYIGLQGGSYLSTTISSIFNLPIYTDSSLTLVRWLNRKSFLSRFIDYCQINTSCCSETEQAEKRQQQRQKRDDICAALENLICEFSNANASQQQTIKAESFTLDSEDGQPPSQQTNSILKAIQRGRQSAPLPSLTGAKKTTFRACYGTLFVTGLWQNFGFTVQAYNASLQFIQDAFQLKAPTYVGAGFSFVNLLTSIGFSIKGLESLFGTLLQRFNDMRSLERKIMPRLCFGITAIFCITAFFSGTGSDQSSYLSWKQVSNEYGGEVAASVAGIAANIGAALAYNLPQCLFLVDRIMQTVIDRSDSSENQANQVFANNLKTLIDIVENLPLDSLEGLYDQSIEHSSSGAPIPAV